MKHRTLETCTYRNNVRPDPEDGETACCSLLAELSGIRDVSLFDASRGACEACLTKHAPSPTAINSVVASLLYGVAQKVSERGGVDGCSLKKAQQLRSLAKDNLEVFMTGGCSPSINNQAAADCFYLGAQTGERDCASCSGSVRAKVFACHHELHGETTIQECRTCPHHERSLPSGQVRNWAVGVTVAPREQTTIEQSLHSLQQAGWQDFRVFAEPTTDLPSWLAQDQITSRTKTLGAWPNWFLALSELVLSDPSADAYLMCQDDVLYGTGLRDYLEETLWPARSLGVVSLHTASHQDRGDVEGYYALDAGWGAWGAQAYVFSPASARALLRNQAVVDHRHKGPGEGLRNIDSVVGQWCRETGLNYFLHTPSLTQHVGETSTIWENSKVTGRRKAATFVGNDSAIADVVGKTTVPPSQFRH